MALGDLPLGDGVEVKALVTATDTLIGSQATLNWVERREAVPYSSKDSMNRRVTPGEYSTDFTLSGIYVPSDSAFGVLRTAVRTGVTNKVTITENGTDVWDVTAVIEEISVDANHGEAAEVTISCVGDDQWATAT